MCETPLALGIAHFLAARAERKRKDERSALDVSGISDPTRLWLKAKRTRTTAPHTVYLFEYLRMCARVCVYRAEASRRIRRAQEREREKEHA